MYYPTNILAPRPPRGMSCVDSEEIQEKGNMKKGVKKK
jgi:hypothetical protein